MDHDGGYTKYTISHGVYGVLRVVLLQPSSFKLNRILVSSLLTPRYTLVLALERASRLRKGRADLLPIVSILISPLVATGVHPGLSLDVGDTLSRRIELG